MLLNYCCYTVVVELSLSTWRYHIFVVAVSFSDRCCRFVEMGIEGCIKVQHRSVRKVKIWKHSSYVISWQNCPQCVRKVINKKKEIYLFSFFKVLQSVWKLFLSRESVISKELSLISPNAGSVEKTVGFFQLYLAEELSCFEDSNGCLLLQIYQSY